jgi:hypothetical protein
MFREKNDQGSLFTALTLLPEEKRRRLEKTWAWAFRTKALPLIDERAFSHLYDTANGRPNFPVQTLIGLLVIKEMFDLTDDDTLFNLEFHMAYQVALALDPGDAHTCQKTLHNFRKRLMECDADKLLFQTVTDKMIQALGVNVAKQRLDSTHIISNMARLTRLGLFCETIRVFLAVLKKDFSKRFGALPESWRKRYLNEDGTATHFGDAKSSEARRRLSVCARDVYRLVDRFRGCQDVRNLEAYSLLERLLADQCEITKTPKGGDDGDADISEPGVPVEVKEPKKISSDSLQSPHDPDATYSGHKGKGYEVQVVETYGNEELPEIITHVALTRSCESDERALEPAMDDLAARDIRPDVLTADTTYGSLANALDCEDRGTELVSPVGGHAAATAKEGEIRATDFFVDPTGAQNAICPAGHTATREERNQKRGTIRAFFDASMCDRCERRSVCPARRLVDGTRMLRATMDKAHLELRRTYEEQPEFKERYADRAGIEATNSEMKRRHGLGHLRVRREPRVRLAMYLKAAACNVKRMVKHIARTIVAAAKVAEVIAAGAN